MTNSPTARPPRTDAVRNRRLLLTAASEAFAEQGTDVSIAEIAQRAGVGKGTVFRHFPTKEDLIAAIMGEIIENLVSSVSKLSDAQDPAAALLDFMTSGIELLARDRGLCEVVGRPSLQQPTVQAGINRLCDAVETLTDRARRQGAVRQDITGQDIVLLLAGVRQTAAPLAETQPQLWRRYLALAFDGIRVQAASPLPYPLPQRLEFPGA
ncbi:TetR/AcrR family transcriptional regulator [Streptomyces mirabilis]|uniref:TetR/AcrR family transcriptional regulator n=1 Tax=Streptomyces mirabilis TaxID=68239 RepID=UPI0036EBCF97